MKGPDAGEVVAAYLVEQRRALLGADLRLRGAEDPDAVHDLRVAARRLRSCITTFRSVLEPPVADLREELRWVGHALGRERDAHVLRERLLAAIDAAPDELVVGPVRTRADTELSALITDARASRVRALDDDRYRQLLDDLAALCANPSFSETAARPARQVLLPLARREWKRTRSRRRTSKATTGTERDAALHETRKAVKRLRYSLEVLQGGGRAVAPPHPTQRAAAGLTDLQDVLGEYQDGVVARAALRSLAGRAELARESGFTYGLLHRSAELDGERAIADFDRRWRPSTRQVRRVLGH